MNFMDKKQEFYLKEALKHLFDLAAQLSYDFEDLEEFRKWAREELFRD